MKKRLFLKSDVIKLIGERPFKEDHPRMEFDDLSDHEETKGEAPEGEEGDINPTPELF